MNSEDEALLSANGWTVECYSPFEIRHDDGSFGSGQAARYTLDALQAEHREEGAAGAGANTCPRCTAAF